MARSAHCIVILVLMRNGNADHAKAFIQGMADSGVGSAIKHYPGLGSVTGNTDFTADGILDTHHHVGRCGNRRVQQYVGGEPFHGDDVACHLSGY